MVKKVKNTGDWGWKFFEILINLTLKKQGVGVGKFHTKTLEVKAKIGLKNKANRKNIPL